MSIEIIVPISPIDVWIDSSDPDAVLLTLLPLPGPPGSSAVSDGDKGDVIVTGTGAVWTLDPAVVRKKYTANRVFYVRNDGNDANNGSANNAGNAFLTLNGAWRWITRYTDAVGYRTSILCTGTFAPLNTYEMPGINGAVYMASADGNPDNFIIAPSGNYSQAVSLYTLNSCSLFINNLTLRGDTGAGWTVYGPVCYNAGNVLFIGMDPDFNAGTIKITGTFDIVFGGAADNETYIGGNLVVSSLSWGKMINGSKSAYFSVFLNSFVINANLAVSGPTLNLSNSTCDWYSPAITGSGTPTFAKQWDVSNYSVVTQSSIVPGSAVGTTGFTAAGGGGSSPVIKTANFTLAAGEEELINNKSASSCTVTLPAASAWPGRKLNFLNYQAQALVSASSNVVPITGGAAGTAILAATAGKWATLISNGTNWLVTRAG